MAGMASVRRLVCAGTVRDAGAGAERSLAPLDALAGFVLLPFGNFFLRARTVFAALRTHLQDRTGTRKVLHLIVTAAVTMALCGVAWGCWQRPMRTLPRWGSRCPTGGAGC